MSGTLYGIDIDKYADALKALRKHGYDTVNIDRSVIEIIEENRRLKKTLKIKPTYVPMPLVHKLDKLNVFDYKNGSPVFGDEVAQDIKAIVEYIKEREDM